MRPLNRTDLGILLADRPGPCVSIYMATDRSYPANKKGPIRYANAVRTAEEDLGRRVQRRDGAELDAAVFAGGRQTVD